MKTVNISFDSIEALRDALTNDDSICDSPHMLIQLFVARADKDFIKRLQALMREKFALATLIGATTDGTIDGEKIYNDTVSVANFTTFSDATIQSFLIEHKRYGDDSYRSGIEMARQLCKNGVKVLITFSDGLYTNGEEYLRGIEEYRGDVVVAGGMAGDNGFLQETLVFLKEGIVNNGAVGVSIASKALETKRHYIFDWQPIGKKMTVTKAIKNRVFEIDGKSVVDVYRRYLGKEVADGLPQVGIEFPLVFEKEGMLIGRAVLSRHDDGSLTFAGNIEEGTVVRFSIGNVNSILRNNYRQIRMLMKSLEHKSEGLFIYSCMARRRFLGDLIADELQLLSKVAVCSGFFTYGEFYHTDKTNELLNETMTILSLSESKELPDRSILENIKPYSGKVDVKHILARLVNTVSSELEELNANLERRVKESSEYIYKQAYFNKLTGLPNRLSLIQRLEECIGKVIILVNIDNFGMINDFYGHTIGDMILKKIATLLKEFGARYNAEAFKLPSDEYALIVNIEHVHERIEALIELLIDEIENGKFIVDGHRIHVSVSVSAAFINRERKGMINADMAMKMAKQSAKKFVIYDGDMKLVEQYEMNITMANIIKDAIHNDRIIPYFQPIYEVGDEKTPIKYEALVRLIKSDGEVLAPGAFLDISKKIKLYPMITKIMIKKCFEFFSKNGADFSINLSFDDINDKHTRIYIFDMIRRYDVAKQLTIEILETQEIDYSETVLNFIDDVYKVGANIAIDDFGSGFANFEYMTRIQSDIIKIDGSLVKNIDSDKNAKLVVETIVIFTKKLGKKSVAEFVHSKEIYDIVKNIGVDYVQGYYFAQPQPTLIKA